MTDIQHERVNLRSLAFTDIQLKKLSYTLRVYQYIILVQAHATAMFEEMATQEGVRPHIQSTNMQSRCVKGWDFYTFYFVVVYVVCFTASVEFSHNLDQVPSLKTHKCPFQTWDTLISVNVIVFGHICTLYKCSFCLYLGMTGPLWKEPQCRWDIWNRVHERER